MNNEQTSDDSEFLATLKYHFWHLILLFGITDRSIASLSDGYLSDIVHYLQPPSSL